MSRFLTLTSYNDALAILHASAPLSYQNERIQVTKSLGRMLHQPVYAKLTVPHTTISQRDGYAVFASDTLLARDSEPGVLQNYAFVHTGSEIPNGYDAVIMQEDVRIEPDQVLILKPARPGQNIQKAGSETSIGKMILPAGHVISAADIGAMTAYGVTTVEIKKLTVTLLPVGDELKEPCTAPGPGEVIESNVLMLKAYLESLGIATELHPIIPDSPQEIKTAILQAVLDSSFVIISGGTSMGKRDYTKSVLIENGTMLYHGVAMRPGRTTLAALVDGVTVFGLPGVPAGAISVFEEIILPWLSDCGFPVPMKHIIQATLAESIPSDIGTDDFIQMVVGEVNKTYQAIMVPRGNGQMTHVRTNGILHIAHMAEGLKWGDTCHIRLIRPYPHPKNILLVSGISDLIIDILDQFLQRKQIRLYCRPAKTDAVLLGMQNKGIHGGIIERFHINDTWCDIDYSLLLEPSSAIHIADQVYIMASLEGEDVGEEHGVSWMNETETIQKIKKGEIDAGPCSEHLAADYNLSGPVIGYKRMYFLVRNEDLESEQIKEIRSLLSSDEWKSEVDLVVGYSTERSGEISPLTKDG